MTQVIVADANVLINLIHVDRLGICGSIPDHEFLVPDHVAAEILQPAQQDRLASAIAQGHLRSVSIENLEIMASFVAMTDRLGRGEAACLAIAQASGFSVASDERGLFRRMAIETIGADRLITTPGVYVAAIRAKV